MCWGNRKGQCGSSRRGGEIRWGCGRARLQPGYRLGRRVRTQVLGMATMVGAVEAWCPGRSVMVGASGEPESQHLALLSGWLLLSARAHQDGRICWWVREVGWHRTM